MVVVGREEVIMGEGAGVQLFSALTNNGRISLY